LKRNKNLKKTGHRFVTKSRVIMQLTNILCFPGLLGSKVYQLSRVKMNTLPCRLDKILENAMQSTTSVADNSSGKEHVATKL